jgi:hypothetical protein
MPWDRPKVSPKAKHPEPRLEKGVLCPTSRGRSFRPMAHPTIPEELENRLDHDPDCGTTGDSAPWAASAETNETSVWIRIAKASSLLRES